MLIRSIRWLTFGCIYLAASCHALKILISNDDSWGTANIHAIYNAAKKAGHQAIISAPAMQMSGTDGLMRQRQALEQNGEFDLVSKGASAEGHDLKDDHIWYVNTTPASSVKYGMQVLAPRYFDSLPDVVIAGTNQGFNQGLAYLVSGTFGAAKFAIKHGIPGIACSAGNEAIRPYTGLKGSNDQANIYAGYVMDLVSQLERTRKAGEGLLPPGVGLNVNFPDANSNSVQTSRRKWVQTRLLSTIETSPDTCLCGQKDVCKLPTEEKIGRAPDSSVNTISVFEPRLFGPDARVHLQAAIAKRLEGFTSCP